MRSIARQIEELKKLIPAEPPACLPLYMPPIQGMEAPGARMFLSALQHRDMPPAEVADMLRRLPRAEDLCDSVPVRYAAEVRHFTDAKIMDYLRFAILEIEADFADRRRPQTTHLRWEFRVSDEQMNEYLTFAKTRLREMEVGDEHG